MLKNIRWTASRAVATSAGRVRSPTTTSAPSAQGIGAVVVVMRHRSYGPAALAQQRHHLAAHAADSPAGTSHQDETRLSHRPPALVFVKSFRMAKSDLHARPACHRKRDSIEAHLTIEFAALAVSRWIENQADWSIRNFIKTARRHRTIQIRARDHVITAADPLPDDLRAAPHEDQQHQARWPQRTWPPSSTRTSGRKCLVDVPASALHRAGQRGSACGAARFSRAGGRTRGCPRPGGPVLPSRRSGRRDRIRSSARCCSTAPRSV
jgi:hypothetical protein